MLVSQWGDGSPPGLGGQASSLYAGLRQVGLTQHQPSRLLCLNQSEFTADTWDKYQVRSHGTWLQLISVTLQVCGLEQDSEPQSSSSVE